MTQFESIVQGALALPIEERASLIDVLEQSLQTATFDAADVSDAWAGEIQRRVEAFKRGEFELEDARSAIREMRQTLAKRRADRAAS